MKTEFIKTLRATGREGVEGLIEEMEEGGFFTAPCSGQYHLCKEGGLVEHSMNVLRMARTLNRAFDAKIPDDVITICSLLHDLGKMGDHGKHNYVENILKGGKKSDARPYITNTKLVYLDHEIRSVMIAERYIKLSEEEEQAIIFHNGLYGTFKYEIQGKETPLYMILHFADMWASRVIEKGD